MLERSSFEIDDSLILSHEDKDESPYTSGWLRFSTNEMVSFCLTDLKIWDWGNSSQQRWKAQCEEIGYFLKLFIISTHYYVAEQDKDPTRTHGHTHTHTPLKGLMVINNVFSTLMTAWKMVSARTPGVLIVSRNLRSQGLTVHSRYRPTFSVQ